MEMIEIVWHGRGGQGAVTASKVLATGALYEGKNIQAFPEYGAERAGAPVKSYNRISDEVILVHDPVHNPCAAVVLDETLLDVVDVTDGVNKNGTILVNSAKTPKEIRSILKLDPTSTIKVFTVDATSISIAKLGRNIPNTTMIGALVKVTKSVRLESLLESFKNEFKSKFKQSVLDGNVEAIKTAYQEVKGE